MSDRDQPTPEPTPNRAGNPAAESSDRAKPDNYARLAIVMGVGAVALFLASFALVNSADDFHPSPARGYSAILMISIVGIIIIVTMWRMYNNRTLNFLLIGIFLALIAFTIYAGRTEALVGDEQLLQTLIPHHSEAILFCEQSDITDPEVQALCDEIVEHNEDEIDQMNELLDQ